jgi:hypothetical protein
MEIAAMAFAGGFVVGSCGVLAANKIANPTSVSTPQTVTNTVINNILPPPPPPPLPSSSSTMIKVRVGGRVFKSKKLVSLRKTSSSVSAAPINKVQKEEEEEEEIDKPVNLHLDEIVDGITGEDVREMKKKLNSCTPGPPSSSDDSGIGPLGRSALNAIASGEIMKQLKKTPALLTIEEKRISFFTHCPIFDELLSSRRPLKHISSSSSS